MNVTIAPGAVYNYTFVNAEDFSAQGTYTIVAAVANNTPDHVTKNDTLVNVIKHLSNEPVSLNLPFFDDLEGATNSTYSTDTIGIAGADRYDFTDASVYGRLRTFVNTGVAFSGAKAFVLDAERTVAVPHPVISVNGTFNLASYNVNTNDIRLDFKARNGYFFNIMQATGFGQEAAILIRGWKYIITETLVKNYRT